MARSLRLGTIRRLCAKVLAADTHIQRVRPTALSGTHAADVIGKKRVTVDKILTFQSQHIQALLQEDLTAQISHSMELTLAQPVWAVATWRGMFLTFSSGSGTSAVISQHQCQKRAKLAKEDQILAFRSVVLVVSCPVCRPAPLQFCDSRKPVLTSVSHFYPPNLCFLCYLCSKHLCSLQS
jgi:hypothetical protein